MAFIGNTPTAVPLTGSQIADGTIVNANIATNTINLTQKVTSTLPFAQGGTGLSTLGTAGQALIVNSSATALEFAAVSDNFSTQLLHVRDEKSSGTAAQTLTSGSFVKRDLNTVMTNEISGASLSSSVITLPSGTYFIYAGVPFYANKELKSKLRNTSDSTDTLIGTSGFTSDSNGFFGWSWVIGRFTIAAQKNFEIQARVGFTDTGGKAVNFSVVEVYTDVQIWKVA
jgi:hypothetical protein